MLRVHLRRRGNTFYLDYHLHGKRFKQSLQTDNPKIASRIRAETEYKLQAQLLRITVNISVDDFLKEYFSYLQVKLRKETVITKVA